MRKAERRSHCRRPNILLRGDQNPELCDGQGPQGPRVEGVRGPGQGRALPSPAPPPARTGRPPGAGGHIRMRMARRGGIYRSLVQHQQLSPPPPANLKITQDKNGVGVGGGRGRRVRGASPQRGQGPLGGAPGQLGNHRDPKTLVGSMGQEVLLSCLLEWRMLELEHIPVG